MLISGLLAAISLSCELAYTTDSLPVLSLQQFLVCVLTIYYHHHRNALAVVDVVPTLHQGSKPWHAMAKCPLG